MEFISEDLAQRAEPTEAELQAFLAEHAERFREPSRISFAQVYLSPDRRDDARRDAERMLVALDAGRSDPAAAGDPFLLEQGYSAVTAQDIDRLFGGRFAARLGELPVGRWSGPVASGCGLHLVLVQERIQAREPELDEVRDAVADERRVTRRDEANQAFYESLRARYQVTVERPAASIPADMELAPGALRHRHDGDVLDHRARTRVRGMSLIERTTPGRRWREAGREHHDNTA
jgi:hypothetical protein